MAVKEIELSLAQILRWPLLPAKLLGYWPLTVKGSSFQFTWRSTGVYFSVLNVTLITVLSFELARNGAEGMLEKQLVSATEIVGYSAVSILETGAIMSLILFTLLSNEEIVEFWNHISRVTSVVGCSLKDCAETERICWAKILTRDQSYIRWLVGFTVILSVVQSVIGGVAYLMHDEPHSGNRVITFYHCCLFNLWYFSVMSYVHMANLLTGAVRVITSAWKILGMEVSALCAAPQVGHEQVGQAMQRIGRVRSVLTMGRDLEEVIGRLNRAYKYHLIVIVGTTVADLTIGAFFVMKDLMKGEGSHLDSVAIISAEVMFFVALHALCSAADDLTAEAQTYGKSLSKLVGDHLGWETTSMVQVESVRLSIKPPTVSPGRYCTLGTELIASVIAILVTYSLVMLQFDQVKTKG